MAVRRLAEIQPDEFAFSAENRAWADRTIRKFPEGRQASAVIPLLWRAQEQEGWVTKAAIESVAAILRMPTIRVLEVATFYTMFHLEPVGQLAHVQVCGTTPCMLRGSGEIIDICRERIADSPHHLSADKAFSWEEVECLGACVNAPMAQIGSDNYEDLTPETFHALLDAFARGERPRPGPQNGRQTSTPASGLTSLTELVYAEDDLPSPYAGAAKPTGASDRAASTPGTVNAAPGDAPAASSEVAGGEQFEAEGMRRTGEARPESGAGTTPEAANQNIGRVDASGRSDEAASAAMASHAAGAGAQPPRETATVRDDRHTGGDRAAQPRSDRDSARGDKEG